MKRKYTKDECREAAGLLLEACLLVPFEYECIMDIIDSSIILKD